MITFSINNADKMNIFKNDIRKAIIEMSANAIGPLYGDYERFNKEIAQKLKNGDISLFEARQAFVEDFYSYALDGLRTKGNSVVFYDDFNTEGTMNVGGYNLGEMVEDLLEKYPDLQSFGFGSIDYHYSAITYILISVNGETIFLNDEEDGINWVSWLMDFDDYSISELREEMEDCEYSMEQLAEDITGFIAEYELPFSIEEFLVNLGMSKAVKYLS